jgi:hypothetical protein
VGRKERRPSSPATRRRGDPVYIVWTPPRARSTANPLIPPSPPPAFSFSLFLYSSLPFACFTRHYKTPDLVCDAISTLDLETKSEYTGGGKREAVSRARATHTHTHTRTRAHTTRCLGRIRSTASMYFGCHPRATRSTSIIPGARRCWITT